MSGVVVWTDGGCTKPNEAGGWAYVIERDGEILAKASGCHASTTNNRMELKAATEGLIKANELGIYEFTLASDSKYVLQGIAGWLRRWKKNGWKTGKNGKVKNQQMWEALDRQLTTKAKIHFKWIPGHSGVLYNEICDQMATDAAAEVKNGSASRA